VFLIGARVLQGDELFTAYGFPPPSNLIRSGLEDTWTIYRTASCGARILRFAMTCRVRVHLVVSERGQISFGRSWERDKLSVEREVIRRALAEIYLLG
jgi:hypothetical protein